MTIPFGFCHCGCNQKTNLAKSTVPRLGFVKGEPYKFLCGHGRVSKPVGSTPAPNPSGLCMCGCGRTTPLATYTSHQTGNLKGEHKRHCVGHGSSYCHMYEPENESGLCMCGCKQPTRISMLTRKERGYAAGQPENFLIGHQGRKNDYVIEDRGYKGGPCWIWQKHIDKDGYGVASYKRMPVKAHRAYCEKHNGPIPDGYDVDHLCFVRSCVNPDHLEAVPPVVNQRRKRTTRLTMEALRSIPELRSKGLSYAKIGVILGVATHTIFRAHKGLTWKNAEAHASLCK